jgi:CheY-like chemotaxis protein
MEGYRYPLALVVEDDDNQRALISTLLEERLSVAINAFTWPVSMTRIFTALTILRRLRH